MAQTTPNEKTLNCLSIQTLMKLEERCIEKLNEHRLAGTHWNDFNLSMWEELDRDIMFELELRDIEHRLTAQQRFQF